MHLGGEIGDDDSGMGSLYVTPETNFIPVYTSNQFYLRYWLAFQLTTLLEESSTQQASKVVHRPGASRSLGASSFQRSSRMESTFILTYGAT